MKVPSSRKIVLVAFLAGLVFVWGVGAGLYFLASTPASQESRPVIVDIQPGMTLNQVAYQLHDRHLLRSPLAFRLLAYLQNRQNQIQVGEYEIAASMEPREILDKITSGKTLLHAVTIPEGYRVTEIAALLEKEGLADEETFIHLTRDPELAQSLDIPVNTLEGYLFPETYHFSRYTSERKIIQTMLDTFVQRAARPKHLKRAEELNMSFHEIVTLASLIEKETGVDEERKLISSVFHNRLQRNMRLQTDPTVIYSIADFDGNIRKKDLSIDSPYNTYRYAGLPPGPIASPGLDSITAALYPSNTDYLYFVSRQDGSHQFSSTLVDHNRAVQKYQLQKVNSLRNSAKS